MRFLAVSVLAVVVSVGCSSKTEAPLTAGGNAQPAIAVFTTPANLADLDGAHWFDHPWPSDFRRDGKAIRLDGWPNPRETALIQQYLDQMRGKIDGFSPMAAGYLTFTGALDTASLPQDATASLQASSSLQLVDVDDKSPERGHRRPILWTFRDKVGEYYFLPNTISFSPALGHVMRPRTRYAIVVTTDAKDLAGRPAQPNDVLKSVLDGKNALGAAWAPAIAELAKDGIPKEKIAHLSVFTTNDPTEETLKVAEHAKSLPPPTVTKIAADGSNTVHDQFAGSYSGSPEYQQGTSPFVTTGGGFQFDGSGNPVKQGDFELRFKLAVPKADKCPMPTNGYPIVLYAHGTGGDWASFLSDGTADLLAGKCIASMGVDQIFHGTYPGAPPLTDPNKESKTSLYFFNFQNADAARTNIRQSAIDEVARAHLVKSGGLVVPASMTRGEIKFDPDRIGFFGHSQGGLNGAVLLAVDDQERGGVLSGAGSAISYSLLMKTKPDPSVANLVKAFIGIGPDNEDEWGPLHPALALVQTIEDPADPVHYYAGIAKAPYLGHAPKSVFMTEGINPDGTGDNYAPPRTIEAGAIAGGFPLAQPVVFDIPEITQLDGVAPVALPVKGNAASGKATVVLAQFSPPAGTDGHFVVFDVPKAKTLSGAFCASLLGDGVPQIGP